MHNTLWSVFDAISDSNTANKVVSNEFDNYLFTGGLNIGERFNRSFEIDSLKGKNTRKGLHVVIIRMEASYELVQYVL